MATRTYEGFSVSHAAILDGVTDAETLAAQLADVYGVRDGTLTVNEGNYDNNGDDTVLSSWFWFNHVDVTIKAGYIPFDTIALITGAAISSSGAGAGATFSLPLWETQSTNQPSRPMLIRVPSKDSDGNIRNLDFVMYRVIFTPLKFEGPTFKSGLVVNYSGRAVAASTDEAGNALPQQSIGRVLSTPAT